MIGGFLKKPKHWPGDEGSPSTVRLLWDDEAASCLLLSMFTHFFIFFSRWWRWFEIVFNFQPDPCGNDPNLTFAYFSNGLETTNYSFAPFFLGQKFKMSKLCAKLDEIFT